MHAVVPSSAMTRKRSIEQMEEVLTTGTAAGSAGTFQDAVHSTGEWSLLRGVYGRSRSRRPQPCSCVLQRRHLLLSVTQQGTLPRRVPQQQKMGLREEARLARKLLLLCPSGPRKGRNRRADMQVSTGVSQVNLQGAAERQGYSAACQASVLFCDSSTSWAAEHLLCSTQSSSTLHMARSMNTNRRQGRVVCNGFYHHCPAGNKLSSPGSPDFEPDGLACRPQGPSSPVASAGCLPGVILPQQPLCRKLVVPLPCRHQHSPPESSVQQSQGPPALQATRSRCPSGTPATLCASRAL